MAQKDEYKLLLPQPLYSATLCPLFYIQHLSSNESSDFTTGSLAQIRVALILPDRTRMQKTDTFIFENVWVPKAPTEPKASSRRRYTRGREMHVFSYRSDTDKCTQGKGHLKEMQKPYITEPPTCTTKMTMPIVPSRCLLSSSHSSTFSKQP